jgi:hypothetical protein
MAKDIIHMLSQELSRYDIIREILNGKINGTEASVKLRLTKRHIRRLKKVVKQYGAQGLIHRNRGKPSNRKMCSKIMAQAKLCLKKHYADFKPSFASEKLQERHGIKLGRETVRQIMIDEKLWKPKLKKETNKHRRWRQRKDYYGEMQQFDGSYHLWFEDRGKECCLLASIDDSTSKITHAKFVNREGVKSAFTFWKEYITIHGKPMNLYLDRHSTYKVNAQSVFDDKSVLTQCERAMKDLDIHVIHAYSPQAKGRVERLFGTLQDRLIKEMRLEHISTIAKANEFLQKKFISQFNERFAVVPEKKGDMHRKLSKVDTTNLDTIFSQQHTRKVHNDFTISFMGTWYQLKEQQTTTVLRKDDVLLEERLDGTLWISLRGKYLKYTVLKERPKKVIKMRVTALTKERQIWKPPVDHPWRRSFIVSPSKVENELARAR